jgi:hypothetical protein
MNALSVILAQLTLFSFLLFYEDYGRNSIIGHVIVAGKLFVPKLLTKNVICPGLSTYARCTRRLPAPGSFLEAPISTSSPTAAPATEHPPKPPSPGVIGLKLLVQVVNTNLDTPSIVPAGPRSPLSPLAPGSPLSL